MIPGGGVGFALALAWSLALAGFCLVVGGELQLCTVAALRFGALQDTPKTAVWCGVLA